MFWIKDKTNIESHIASILTRMFEVLFPIWNVTHWNYKLVQVLSSRDLKAAVLKNLTTGIKLNIKLMYTAEILFLSSF